MTVSDQWLSGKDELSKLRGILGEQKYPALCYKCENIFQHPQHVQQQEEIRVFGR